MKASLIALLLPLAAFTTAQPVNETQELSARSIQCASINKCSASDAKELVSLVIYGGTNKYSVDSTWRQLFYFNSCHMYGKSVNAPSATSYARDIGYGAQNTINKCQNGNENAAVGGTNAAGGNGYFLVNIGTAEP